MASKPLPRTSSRELGAAKPCPERRTTALGVGGVAGTPSAWIQTSNAAGKENRSPPTALPAPRCLPRAMTPPRLDAFSGCLKFDRDGSPSHDPREWSETVRDHFQTLFTSKVEAPSEQTARLKTMEEDCFSLPRSGADFLASLLSSRWLFVMAVYRIRRSDFSIPRTPSYPAEFSA